MAKQEEVNILIVDDKETNIFAIEQMLAKKGRWFHRALNGKDALKILLNREIDLIILDVQMPDMDGFEVAHILKSNKRTKYIPIIFASAEKREQRFMLKGIEEGAIDYLYKPLDRELTEAKVSVLLNLQLQKKKLIASKARLEKYGLLINNSADIIGIVNPKTLRFEEINNTVTTLLGYSAEEVKGESLKLYLPDEYHRQFELLRNDPAPFLSFETQLYCKDRSMKWLQWNIVHKSGLWFVNARDVSEAKEVEEIKNYLSTVVKQSNDAVYLHSPDGQIISWNKGAEQIYGYTEQEALNMKIWNIVPDFLLDEAQAVAENILSGRQIESLETKRITKYGKIIDVAFSASLLTDSENRLQSVAITERNITEQKRAEREIRQLNADLRRNVVQLESTNKELESFSYSVSHDLRAPLRAVNGFAHILRAEHGEGMDEEVSRLLQIIQNNAHKMGGLIDDLLAFSRLGRKEVVKTQVDMNAMVQQILSEQTNQRQAKVEVHDLMAVEADYTLLYQVFFNLISNALKYSSKSKEPRIEIGAYEKGEDYVYFVKDNGTGFDMEYVHKLFGVFQRLHSDEEFEGTGVGLAIVHRIVSKHGGHVWAEGVPDQGATFYVALPKPITN